MERTSRHSMQSTATDRLVDRGVTRQAWPTGPEPATRHVRRRRPPRLSPVMPVVATATWGLVTATVGSVVLLRARELESTTSVVELAGTTHTARLGVIEVCFGLVMMLAAATRSRLVLGAMAAALAVTGVFMLLERRRVAEELAVGAVDAWFVIATSSVLAVVLVCSGSSRP